MGQYYVYILTNFTNSVLYIGVTNDLERRTSEHKSESVDGFTKKYHLTKLIYQEAFQRVEDAIAAEKKLKGWRRSKKEALINSVSPKWQDLSAI